ncbi:acetyltransferase [Crateriforma conspicua]|uniref:acetyltransferase n=1 Tax=Crateriforma conspicua TaxID=2527996 RepID=UPI00119D4F7B|nr:acetyltransferase [Crateriforma conspicua]
MPEIMVQQAKLTENADSQGRIWHENNVLVIGAGGHSKVVCSTLRLLGWNIIGALDDHPQGQTSLPILGRLCEIDEYWNVRKFIGIGCNRLRAQIDCDTLVFVPGIVHPASTVDLSASVSEGAVVMAGAVIQADAVVGRHTIVNTHATIEHDCTVGDYCHIAPAACLTGNVSIGQGTLIGAGATITPGVSVGRWAVVGAGATVINNIADGQVVVGTPARPIRQTDTIRPKR